MKIYQSITILILVSYVYTKYCDASKPENPTKTDDCTSHKANDGYCCFEKSKGGNYCAGYGPKAYKAIKEFVKLNKKCNIDLAEDEGSDDCVEDKDYSIDCKSSYLVLSLLSLILLFL